MITISLLGVDKYLAPELVKKIHQKIANLYESSPEEVIFYAPDSFLIYDGVEQTSFQLNVIVDAPVKYKGLEKNVANFLLKSLTDYAIHIHVQFRYFESENEYSYINEDYPRYMTETNVLKYDEAENFDEKTEEPYLGNAFAEYEDKFDLEPEETDEEEDECEDDHECSCGHHHHHE